MLTIMQLAYRISNNINSIPRKNRDFTKNDFRVFEPLPLKIYDQLIAEFPNCSADQQLEFTRELNKLVET